MIGLFLFLNPWKIPNVWINRHKIKNGVTINPGSEHDNNYWLLNYLFIIISSRVVVVVRGGGKWAVAAATAALLQ